MSYINKKRKAPNNEAGALSKEQDKGNKQYSNSNDSRFSSKIQVPSKRRLEFDPLTGQSRLIKAPEMPSLKIVKENDPAITWRFSYGWTDGELIYFRCGKLPKPVGGAFGTTLILNSNNGTFKAVIQPSYEWQELRARCKRITGIEYIEVEPSVLAEAVKYSRNGVKP